MKQKVGFNTVFSMMAVIFFICLFLLTVLTVSYKSKPCYNYMMSGNSLQLAFIVQQLYGNSAIV